jgi:hypothetical protein
MAMAMAIAMVSFMLSIIMLSVILLCIIMQCVFNIRDAVDECQGATLNTSRQ